MMIHLTIDTTLLMAAVAAGLGLLCLVLTAHQWRVAGRLRDRCLVLENGLSSLRRELEVTTAETVLAESKLKRIDRDFSSVSDRMTALESRAESPSFDQAIDSARRGAEPDKLAQRFGLSRGEADLVTRLHGRTKTR
jgi:hypothetical protein